MPPKEKHNYIRNVKQKKKYLADDMMEDNSELLIQNAGALCTLVINRPQKKNLLTASCLQKIAQTLEDCAKLEKEPSREGRNKVDMILVSK